MKWLNSSTYRGKNKLRAKIKIRQINEWGFIFQEFVGVWRVKSVTEDFHCAGFLSAHMLLFNLRSFYINSHRREIIRLGIPRLSKESQNNTIAVRQEIWVLLKMYAGSCQGNGFFCFSLELNGYCPTLCRFVCLCAHVQACKQVCVCLRVCVNVCVRMLSVKRETYKSKLS